MDLKKIERMAQRYLKGKPIGNDEIAKEAKKYANRIKRYKEMSGKNAVKANVKEALHFVTANDFLNGKKIDFLKNIDEFERLGGKPSIEVLKALNYVPAKKVIKNQQSIRKDAPVEVEVQKKEFDKEFEIPELGTVSWYSLPISFRARASHKSGSFMYNNASSFWDGSGVVDLDRLAMWGSDGYDLSLSGFFSIYIAPIRPEIVFMSGGPDTVFYVRRQEWESKQELSPDWIRSRKYR